MATYYRCPQKSAASAASPRNKVKLIVSAVVLLLLAVVGTAVYRVFFYDPEPDLPPEQKIRRNFRKAFNPEESTLERFESLRRTIRASRSIPAETRNQVIVETLAESVNRTFADFTKLPSAQKAERAQLLLEDAERTQRFFRGLPRDRQKKALAILADTPGGRAQVDRALNITTREMSPEDLRMLGPTIKIWKNMLEDRK